MELRCIYIKKNLLFINYKRWTFLDGSGGSICHKDKLERSRRQSLRELEFESATGLVAVGVLDGERHERIELPRSKETDSVFGRRIDRLDVPLNLHHLVAPNELL